MNRPHYTAWPTPEKPMDRPHIRKEPHPTGPIWVVYYVHTFPIGRAMDAFQWAQRTYGPRTVMEYGDPR